MVLIDLCIFRFFFFFLKPFFFLNFQIFRAKRDSQISHEHQKIITFLEINVVILSNNGNGSNLNVVKDIKV